MATPLDLLLRRLARRRAWDRTLTSFAPALALGTMLAATAVVVVRLTMVDGAWLVPAVATAGLLGPAVLLPRLLSRRESPALLAGHLDRLAGADGLVMALAESDPRQRDPGWLARAGAALARVRLPRPDLRPLAAPAFGLLCLIGAAALPQIQPTAPTALAADPTRPLVQEVTALAEAQVITPEERHDLEAQLKTLAAGGLDQATWQGLDRLAQQLDAQAQAAGERLGAVLDAAAKAQHSTPENAAAQAAALGQALAELAATAPGLMPALPPGATQEAMAQALAEAVRQGRITPDQAKALAKAGLKPAPKSGARNLNPGECRSLARDLEKSLAGKCKGLGKGKSASALRRFLEGRKGFGEGDVSRGPGHAPLERVARDPLEGGASAPLAEGLVENPDGSVTVATQSRDPQADAAAQAALTRAAARTFDPTAADSRRAVIAPRHRGAVQAYFQADAAAGAAPPPPSAPVPTAPAPRATPSEIP